MAYTPINWQSGDTITAEKLNKMDNGWGIQNTLLFSETVTTVAGAMGNSAQLSYTGTDFPESMNITFDGTGYNCTLQSYSARYWYGASSPSDWSTYPFMVLFMNDAWLLITETAGEHTVSASASSLQTSDNFKSAVNSAVDASAMPFRLVPDVTTYDEAIAAVTAGRLLYFYFDDSISSQCFFVANLSTTCTIVPESTTIEARFPRDGGTFYINTL